MPLRITVDNMTASDEIEAAKRHLVTAKNSANFASKMAASAHERVASSLSQLEKARSQLEASRAQLEASRLLFEAAQSQVEDAKSNVEIINDQVAKSNTEVAVAETRLKAVEEKWKVIEVEDDEAAVVVRPSVSLPSSEDEFRSREISLEKHCFVVTEYRVEGCENEEINGSYEIWGTHPSFCESNGGPVYDRVYERPRSVVERRPNILIQRVHRRWVISFRGFRYFSPKILNETMFVPPNKWHRAGETGVSTIHIKPISGIDRNGKEFLLREDLSSSGDVANSQIFVEGCDIPELNGIYQRKNDGREVLTYSNSSYEIFCTSGLSSTTSRWYIRQILPGNVNGPIPYRSPPITTKSTSSVLLPNVEWERFQGGVNPPPRVVLLVSSQNPSDNRKRQRQC